MSKKIINKCECGDTFRTKSTMERHKRSGSCSENKKIKRIYKCKNPRCVCTYMRSDHLRRHMMTCKYKTEVNVGGNVEGNVGDAGKNNNGSVDGTQAKKSNLVTLHGDENTVTTQNITINNYNIVPFGTDGIDCLSMVEKIKIFSSRENPLEMIIFKVNLDPLKPEHHNYGYPDDHSGCGILFDGKQWKSERIGLFMQTLIETKQKDLMAIHDQIKDFLTDDKNKRIEVGLMNMGNVIHPRTMIDTRSKKLLVSHLKKHLYNNRTLVRAAIKKTKNDDKMRKNELKVKQKDEKMINEELKDKQKDDELTMIEDGKSTLRDGLTVTDIINIDNENEEKRIKRLALLKEMGIHMLIENEENIKDLKRIEELIETVTKIDDMRSLLLNMTRHIYFGSDFVFN